MTSIERAAVSALWLVLAASGVAAQQVAPRPAAGDAGRGAAATTAPTQRAYRSAFEGYRPFTDQPVGAWRDANDAVARAADAAMPAGHDHGHAGAHPAASAPVRAPGVSVRPARPDKPPAAGHAGHAGHHAP